jgi:hypothetical protein
MYSCTTDLSSTEVKVSSMNFSLFYRLINSHVKVRHDWTSLMKSGNFYGLNRKTYLDRGVQHKWIKTPIYSISSITNIKSIPSLRIIEMKGRENKKKTSTCKWGTLCHMLQYDTSSLQHIDEWCRCMYHFYGGTLPDFEFQKENKKVEDASNKVYIYL